MRSNKSGKKAYDNYTLQRNVTIKILILSRATIRNMSNCCCCQIPEVVQDHKDDQTILVLKLICFEHQQTKEQLIQSTRQLILNKKMENNKYFNTIAFPYNISLPHLYFIYYNV